MKTDQNGLIGYIENRGGSCRFVYYVDGVKRSVDCQRSLKMARRVRLEISALSQKGDLQPSKMILVPEDVVEKKMALNINAVEFMKIYYEIFRSNRKCDRHSSLDEVANDEEFKIDWSRLKRFWKMIGPLSLKELQFSHIGAYIRERQTGKASDNDECVSRQNGVKPSLRPVLNKTINRELKIIKPMLQFAYNRGFLSTNLAEMIEWQRESKEKEIIIFHNLRDIDYLWRICQEKLKSFTPLLVSMFKTGISPMTVRCFKKEWVLRERSAVVPYRKKSDQKSLIAIDADIHRLLLSLVDCEKNKTPYLFVDHNGNPWTKGTMSAAMRRLQKLSGLNPKLVNCHTFRHTFGSCVTIAKGIEYARQYLQHSNLKTTQDFYVNLEIPYVKRGDIELPFNIFRILGDKIGDIKLKFNPSTAIQGDEDAKSKGSFAS